MLTDNEFNHWCLEHNISPQARSVIETIRNSPPQRNPQGRAGNVSVNYVSQKMGFTLKVESHKNELARAIEFENDKNILEFYNQPFSIKLNYLTKSGKKHAGLYTADFFLISHDSAGWVECKTEEELERLAQQQPNRYFKDETGRWRCPPGEEYAAQFGFFFLVLSTKDINWNFQRNAEYLEAYWENNCPPVDSETCEKVLMFLKENPGVTLDILRVKFEEISADQFNTLIAHEQIYVDLCRAPLAEADRVTVYCDKTASEVYSIMAHASKTATDSNAIVMKEQMPVIWDGRCWTILNLGNSKITLISDKGSLVELENNLFETLFREGKLISLKSQSDNEGVNQEAHLIIQSANKSDLEEANHRYSQIKPYLDGKSPNELGSSVARKLRRWKAFYRNAEQQYGYGYIGLLPKIRYSGNRDPRLPTIVSIKMQEVIEQDYETIKQKKYASSFGKLVNECAKLGLDEPSYKTFVKNCKLRDPYAQVKKRKGERAAYQHEIKYYELDLTTPPHGERAWHICHLDHTEIDLELNHSKTGRNMGKAWVSFLVDAFTRRILVVYLSYDEPSYRTCMMIIRECVRLYNRLPHYLVVDNGKEFSSTYFETQLAMHSCHKKTRPSAKPRFGSVVERLFGTTNTKFVDNLIGNTQITKDVRQITKSVNPKEHSVWTLLRLYNRLWEWINDFYNAVDHPALGQSPFEAYERSILENGLREHTLIPYDETFKLLSLPSTKRGKAKVQPNCGARINYFDYWSGLMRDPGVENSLVDVRYDPDDASVVYAYIKGQWVLCSSVHISVLKGRSEKFISIAAKELRKQRKIHSQNFTIRAAELARFIASCEAEEVLLQGAKDTEVKEIKLQLVSTDQHHSTFPESSSASLPSYQEFPSGISIKGNKIPVTDSDESNDTEPRQLRILGDL